MNAERATVLHPVGKSAETPADRHLRIARGGTEERVHHLLDLAMAVLKEAEGLARDKTFTDESEKLRNLNPDAGINFYDEVENFEIGLIKLALAQTGGNQAKAAKLLHIKPTTLNTKIKNYKLI